jgi:hypothetical protein
MSEQDMEDVEGHISKRPADDDDIDDTEGHMTKRPADDDEDDTEGHKYA